MRAETPKKQLHPSMQESKHLGGERLTVELEEDGYTYYNRGAVEGRKGTPGGCKVKARKEAGDLKRGVVSYCTGDPNRTGNR